MRRHVVVGLARMDDQRQAGLARGRDMGAEALLLRVARAVVVVIVEPGFADRHHLGMARARDQVGGRDVELLVGVVRMGADRAADLGKPLGDRDELGVPLHPGRDRHHAADAGGLRRAPPRRRARSAKSGKSRWQWLSTSIVSSPRWLPARRSAGNTGAGAGSVTPGAMRRARRPARAKSRSSAGTPSRSSSLPADVRHERLRQDRDLPDHLGGDVEHRAHARRIGLGERPRRLAGEIAVGLRHHRPDRGSAPGAAAASPSRRAPCRSWRRRPPGSPGRSSLKAPGAGSTPPQFLRDHRQRALRQIAEIVGEVGIDARRRSPRGCNCRPGRTAPRAGRNSAAGSTP